MIRPALEMSGHVGASCSKGLKDKMHVSFAMHFKIFIENYANQLLKRGMKLLQGNLSIIHMFLMFLLKLTLLALFSLPPFLLTRIWSLNV